MMKKRFVVILMTVCLSNLEVNDCLADEVVLSDDGREVRIKDDGTWEYLSNDRFATSREGRRIRLGDDGKWQVEEDEDDWIAVPAKVLRLSQDTAASGVADLRLIDVTIESARETQQKNTRLRAQMIFTLELTATQASRYSAGRGDFRVSDSRGRQYPIKRLQPASVELREGEKTQLLIIADGSPRWWGVKFFRLEIIGGALVGEDALTLTKSMSEVQKLEVKSLSWE